MILSIILKIVYYFIYLHASILLLLPDVTISQNFADNLSTGIGYAKSINNILPVNELIYTIIGVFLAYEIGYLTLKLINWLIRKIPTIS